MIDSHDGLVYRHTFYWMNEPEPGARWRALLDATWPGLRAWYLDGSRYTGERPSLATSVRMLARHMPELLPIYERMVELVGGDELIARVLTMWSPPPFSPGCSQLAVAAPEPMLCRNYDYSPELFDYTAVSTRYAQRRVIGTNDCLWGLLDGMNDAGLAVSLAFGGRPGPGRGFAIPLVLRYLLEVCRTVADVRVALTGLPVAMSYNVTVLDANAATLTAYLTPDEPAEFSFAPLATNHRGTVPEYPEIARSLRSVERRSGLVELSARRPGPEELAAAFLSPPLYRTAFSRAFGTLYTALYRPELGCVEYLWPGRVWRRYFDDPDASTEIQFQEAQRSWVR